MEKPLGRFVFLCFIFLSSVSFAEVEEVIVTGTRAPEPDSNLSDLSAGPSIGCLIILV